ncbi:RNA recognition motif protein [Rhizoctonia solani 123E]|uniref:RNA recognition motif protein n=1 Tax=Rhizoctonia solani 123E TaxID=1423351 RepID=A0A074RJZ9_9AGAM|nr:RNA recognition motif protein [Rhizoctonia solani 123E]
MQTTRLHISGLTPSISASDLKQRFSTFGDVKDVDGVGKLDGVGRPRKFAYLTLETTQPKLARCMNLLSGSTWKGAKLRIGEAKPDYKARHERKINPPPPAPRPKLSAEAHRRARLKFRLRARRLLRGTQGRQLKDMSIITLETASKHKGWRRTPLNHLIRPMRMRPLHPLPSLRAKQVPSKTKLKKKLTKRKFELTRARCTVIDPARYGAVHLKDGDGLLGAEVVTVGMDEEDKTSGEPVVAEQEPDEESSRSPTPTPPIPTPTVSKQMPAPTTPEPVPALSSPAPQTLENQDLSLVHEKSSALTLLGGMFGQGEWGGRESVSGDEMEIMDVEAEVEVEYEVVPRVADEVVRGAGMEEQAEAEAEEDMSDEADEQEDEQTEDEQDEQESPIKHSSLKDMFKPQEETTGFSLGLDIELDPDAESFLPSSISAPPPEPILAPAPTSTQKHTHTIQFTPNPQAPFFFPGGKNDIFRVIAEKGWEWPHPGTSEEIRAKWDKNKAELTREYTKRHREAVKRRRRGGGTKGDEV